MSDTENHLSLAGVVSLISCFSGAPVPQCVPSVGSVTIDSGLVPVIPGHWSGISGQISSITNKIPQSYIVRLTPVLSIKYYKPRET